MRVFDDITNDDCQFSRTIERSFNGIDYLISVFQFKAGVVEIEVEQKCDASRWKGEFTSKYIEEITMKTGNYKRYAIFVRMLRSALESRSDTVAIDVLTYNDLERLRESKETDSMAQNSTTREHKLIPNNKRYLILTHLSEFDRVHYPLPLAFEDKPDPERLRKVICELRTEIESLKKPSHQEPIPNETIEEMEAPIAVPIENRPINRCTVSRTAQRRSIERELRSTREERDMLQNKLQELQITLERERCLHRKEIRQLVKESAKIKRELQQSSQELRQQRSYSQELQRQIDTDLKRNQSRSMRAGSSLRLLERRYPKPAPPRSRIASPRTTMQTTTRRQSRDVSPAASTGNCSNRSVESRTSSCRSKTARFDPTAYVRQQQDKVRRLEQRRRSNCSSKRSSRPTSADSRASKYSILSRSSTKSTTKQPSRTPSKQSVTDFAKKRVAKSTSSHQFGYNSEPSVSPTSRLQAIKDKLQRFVETPTKAASIDLDSDTKSEDVDAHCKIDCEENGYDDVDHRLSALQQFLKNAKNSIDAD